MVAFKIMIRRFLADSRLWATGRLFAGNKLVDKSL
jgi:hypothetical protein